MEMSVIEYSILLECSDFLYETQDKPMYKVLQNQKTQDKVKIRQKSQSNQYDSHLDQHINYKNFLNRSLTLYTSPITSNDLYYIFVPDGYKCITTKDNLNIDLNDIFENLSNSISDVGKSFQDLLSYSYEFNNLKSGILINDNIIFYNIPYYYCIRVNGQYDNLEFLKS